MATTSELLVERDQRNKPEDVLSPKQSMPEESVESSNEDLETSGSSLDSPNLDQRSTAEDVLSPEQSMPEESVESSNEDLEQSGSSPESRTLFQLNTEVAGDKYLQLVEQRVLKQKGECISVKSQSGSNICLRIARLNDTIYSESTEEVDGWGKFYLPQEVEMRVFAVVEDMPCPCDQLVLMTCGNDTVYGYDGEELHEMASDLQELRDECFKYPASKSYYYGEAFKDMSDADWAKVRKGAVGQRLDEEHQKLVKKFESKFLECLS